MPRTMTVGEAIDLIVLPILAALLEPTKPNEEQVFHLSEPAWRAWVSDNF